jgi:hypothetical protein
MNEMEERRIDELLERINGMEPHRSVDRDDCLLDESPLPFYRDGTLVELTDYTPVLPLTRCFVATASKIVPLDGTRDALERANLVAGLQLSECTVVAYCRFWFRAVYAPEDSFKIVERMADVEFTGEADRETRDAVALALRSARVYPVGDGYRVHAFVLYADTLYKATLAVNRNGALDVVEETVVRENVPTRDILLE